MRSKGLICKVFFKTYILWLHQNDNNAKALVCL